MAVCIRALIPAMMQAALCKNLVNFGAVTSEITFLICLPLCGYWTKFGLRSPFIALAFADALDD